MDEPAFTEWAVGAQRHLLRAAVLLTGDLQAAEDLVQEALAKVAVRWDRLGHENPTGYARTIMVRDNISRWRRRGPREVSTVTPAELTAVSSEPETALVVRQALARLTAKQRAVVVLRHFEDLSVEEVATVLQVGVGTVKSQNSAALARLRGGAPELLDLMGGPR